MDILGSIGKLYTFLLLVVLFLGSGLAVWAGINAIMNRKDNLKESTNKIKSNISVKLHDMKNNNIIGGISMKNNGFIKLAVFSFVGIIISAAILAALPKYTNGSMNNMNMNMNSGYTTTAMNMQGMTGYSTGTMSTGTDLYSIQQQLNYMQQQIYQLQNQMNNMNNMNNMNSSSSGNMNSMNGNSSGSSNNSNSSSMSSMPMM